MGRAHPAGSQPTADVLVYFNNDWEGFAIHNARLMQDLLARAS